MKKFLLFVIAVAGFAAGNTFAQTLSTTGTPVYIDFNTVKTVTVTATLSSSSFTTASTAWSVTGGSATVAASTFSNSNKTVSAVATVTAAGTLTFKLSYKVTGNNTTVTSTVTVYASSTKINPSSTAAITSGGYVDFTNSTTGFPSGTTTYSWQVTPSTGVTYINSTTAASSAPRIQFASPGNYSVQLTASNPTVSSTSTATTVVVNNASTVTASASNTAVTLPNMSTLTSTFTANGNSIVSYQWAESASDAYQAIIATPAAASSTVTFRAAGTYNFTLSATYKYLYGNSSVTVSNLPVVITVTQGSAITYPNNLYAISSTGNSADLMSLSVGTNASNSGMIISNPVKLATLSSTQHVSSLGKDAAGYLYFMSNMSNNSGVFDLYAAKPDGTSVTKIISAFDLNGSASGDMGFVRLAIDKDGTGWILAGDNNNLYLAKFLANKLNPTTLVTVNSNVTVVGGGVSDFSSGDLAFDNSGLMFVLANSNNNTYIFTMIPSVSTTTLTKKWTLVDPKGANFTGSVNGNAFDSAGSMYISTSTGLYFIDANTVNTSGAGTVQTSLVWSGTGLTDIATNVFPKNSPLPITLGAFTAVKSGNNAILNWTTLVEQKNDHIDIQRSLDGVNFITLGSVEGQGTTSIAHKYAYTDILGSITGVVYYRLRDVDMDGQGTFSKIIALHIDAGTAENTISVYPNPFASDIKISTHSAGDAKASVRISNLAGQQVSIQAVQLQSGDNIVVVSNLQHLVPGMYIVQFITEKGTITQKIIKK